MTYHSAIDYPSGSEKHDRSFISPFARTLAPARRVQPDWLASPLVPAPGKAELRWLSGLRDPAVFNGLDRPWWQLVLPALSGLIATWRQRSRARQQLARIDAYTLRDAGISPGAALFEASQPFWVAPTPLRDIDDDRTA
ncbi:DUF1127 domain-containing protein [Ferrovibrio sp.]|uniref:DUF1127 domain-containing protein n=1 Tax=Ferrovibrio sp. TaxID=1917215 RepID=UPI00262B1B1C|nr:DUF1127 domain-containing protein [Ferrovibrio sp.]